jgi:hypothetical protein
MSQVRGRPFEPGNRLGRGRPKGSRNKRSTQAQEILDQYLESLVKTCVGQALKGDVRALALCLERILPPLREPTVKLGLPRLNNLKDVAQCERRLVRAIASGKVTPGEGERISNVLDHHRRAIETNEVVARIEELEKRATKTTHSGGGSNGTAQTTQCRAAGLDSAQNQSDPEHP